MSRWIDITPTWVREKLAARSDAELRRRVAFHRDPVGCFGTALARVGIEYAVARVTAPEGGLDAPSLRLELARALGVTIYP